jgi:carboxymethylenebutenolidase
MRPVSKIETKKVVVQNEDLLIECYLAVPEAIPEAVPEAVPEVIPKNHKGAVIVLHEVFGVNAHLRSVVDRLAQEGYAAIAPNMVQRSAPGLALDQYDAESLLLGRSHKDLMTAEQIASDLGAVIRAMACEKVAIVGFCFGGHVAYLGAMLPEVVATAVFYGSGIGVMTPGGGEPTVMRTAEISGRVLMLYGLRDDIIPHEQADAVEAALIQADVRHEVVRYDAGHGFFCGARDSFDGAAAADAWERVLGLLR